MNTVHKISELKQKPVAELKDLVISLLREKFKLTLVKAQGELTKTHRMREIRRTIARIETILTEQKGNK